MATSFKTSESLLFDLKKMLIESQASLVNQEAFVAFDGFIDTLQKAVHHSVGDEVTYFSTITDFANHLQQMDGKSGQVELVTNQVKMGGNAPILANALGQLGIKTTCMGSMGIPEINPLFNNISNPLVNRISVAEPGKSRAIEFDNGKIIFSDLSGFKKYDWDYIKDRVGLPTLKKIIESSRLIGLVDWANLSKASQLWKGLLEDIIKPQKKKDRFFLFDLCDPSRKSKEQIKDVLELISCYSEYGSVTLGLNENEANKIWLSLHGIDLNDSEKIEIPDLRTVGYFIYRALEIDTLLIHPIDRTIVFKNQKELEKQSIIELKGHLVTDPKIQTGAGDNLNAGYCFGQMAGFEIQYCMLLGMAVAGTYVQNGTSPDVKALLDYIDNWVASALSH